MTLQVQQAVSTYYIIPDCFMTTCKITTDMMLSHVYVCDVTHQYVCVCNRVRMRDRTHQYV